MDPVARVGRYVLHGVIGRGGMATVHFGQMLGEAGFKRTVAIKRLHPHLANELDLVTSLLDEAHLAARIHHPNVVATHDVVRGAGEVFVVMEYVPGESLSRLLKDAERDGLPPSPAIVGSMMCGALHGLHAAHEATKENGEPLHIVHRDVSPHNLLVGSDGITRVLDFGVAKAVGRLQSTQDGQIKGKLPYMAPEQLRGARVDRRTDVFAAGIVLWEALTLQRLFAGDNAGFTLANVIDAPIRRPSEILPGIDEALDAVVMRALERDPAKRYSTARQMAQDLEAAVALATPAQVEAWMRELAGDALKRRATEVAAFESGGAGLPDDGSAASGKTAAPEAILTSSVDGLPRRHRKVLLLGGALLVAATLPVVLLVLAHGRAAPLSLTQPAETRSLENKTRPPDVHEPSAADAVGSTSAPASGLVTQPTDTQVPFLPNARVARAGAPLPTTAASKPSHAPSKPSHARPPGPVAAASAARSEVREYVGTDGVTHFCRPPSCPQ